MFDTAVNEADGSVGFLVTLDPAATGIVTVQYTTVDATAVAPADYAATSGTLTFAPGERRKQTALVPIVNDGEEDTGETFRLVLSSPTGSDANNGAAVLGDAEAVATILNSEEEVASLTGFTLVDAGTNADLMALADGSTVELGELLVASYGIRAEISPGAPPGSMRLALAGAKTVTRTDDASPYSLYGDGAGRVNGQALPVGSYTLRATAYANSGGRGDELGSLEVSFTVAAGVLGVTTPGPFTVAEGETAVAQLAASDTGTGAEASWSIPAGADGAAFALTSKGVLSLVAAKDFEAPDDADGDGTYEVTVSVTVGAQTATAALSVTLADVDEPALSVTTEGPFTVAEGETAVAALAASDTGGGATTSWSIPEGAAGGVDGAAFSVASDGVLSLVAAKDFEAPDDADGDGTYEVTVAAAVPASSMAGAQSATAALLVTLSDVNEAPVAKATASPERVREDARVTLDGSASTDPDAGDTLTYLWTQADNDAPRVTLSDAAAEQPAFTSPSDMAAETALGFTLQVTDAAGLHAEDSVTVTVTLISEVSISAASNYAAEGGEAVFRLTRAGSALRALTVPVSVEETGEMLGTAAPADATFAAGERETELRVPTAADAAPETDSIVTVRLAPGSGWQLAPGAEAATVTVLDDDPAPVTETAAADVTIWSADMTVVEYGPRSIGAGSADLFSNQQGRAGLRAKWLWYDPAERKLKLGFDDGLDDAESLTLHVGDVSLGFPEDTGGNSSFSLEGVDLSWTDGETLAARVSKPSASAVSTDATLSSLGVEGATLSPAFDAGVVLYRAVADAGAETMSVSARANDDGATVAYGPAADGTVRLYRVVVAPTAAGSNAAPTGAPTITGTPQVGETLTADTSDIADEDGLDDVSYSYQWIRNDNGTESYIVGGASSTYILDADDVGKTVQVRVTFTDDAGNEETLTSEATDAVAAKPNSEATGLPTITGTPQVDETLTASTSAINDEDGLDDVEFNYQWIANDGNGDTDIDDATDSTYTPSVTYAEKTIKVRVSFSDDAGNDEVLTSAATGAVAVVSPGPPVIGPHQWTDYRWDHREIWISWSPPIYDGGAAATGYDLRYIRDDASDKSDDNWTYENGLTGTSYTVDDLTNGVMYNIQVRAVNRAGSGAWSATFSETPRTLPPDAYDVSVTPGNQTLTVEWSEPPVGAQGGVAIANYVVVHIRTDVPDHEFTDLSYWTASDIIPTSGPLSYTITGLTNGGSYFVKVRSINALGDISYPSFRNFVLATPNSRATGLPTITGTPQVGQTLTADTSNIADEDGLNNVSYSHQWIRSDNGADTDIAGETDSTYTLVLADMGKTIKVQVTFTDDADNQENLTSEATVAVAAAVPTAPLSLTVTPGDQSQELHASWQAPSSNGGSDVTGYKVQWKESTDSWDTETDVSDTTVTGTTHTITSLTGGVEYAVRVIATNVAGDGPASTEARATPVDSPTSGEEGTETGESDSTAAWTATLTVGVSGSGSEAVWGYSWFLDGMGTLDGRTYSEGGQTIEVMAILLSNGFVAFNVRPHPSVDFVLTVDGTEFASADASEVKSRTLISYVWATTLDWAEDDRVALSLTLKDTDSAEQSEPAENTPATGLPTISGTPQAGQTLTANTTSISDADGLDNVDYSYQWIGSNGNSDTDLQDATASAYTPSVSDVGKTIKVKVSFTDDANNDESLTSVATTAVAATVPTAPLSLTVATGDQIQELDASWQAPSSNGGAEITGYKVQWKAAADSWDTAAEVSVASETGTTHTITDLTGGVEHSVRVIATNIAGDGPASTEVKGTPAGAVSEQVVEPENSAPTGLPGISGTPQVDQTLTADTSPIRWTRR